MSKNNDNARQAAAILRSIAAVCAVLLTAASLFTVAACGKKQEQPTVDHLEAEYDLEVNEDYAKTSLCMIGETVYDTPHSMWFDNQKNKLLIANDYGEPGDDAITEGHVDNDALKDIAKYKNLQTLCLENQPLTDITPITGLPLIRKLNLNYCPIESLEGIGALKELEELHIEGTKITDLTPLFECTKLRALFISDGADIESLEGFEALQQLRYVEMSRMNVTSKDYSPLFKCGKLRFLYLENTNINSIEGVDELDELIELGIDGTPVADLSPAGGCDKLESIAAGTSKLSDVSGLKNAPKLKYIAIGYPSHISDISGITEIPNLEKILFYDEFASFKNDDEKTQLYDRIFKKLDARSAEYYFMDGEEEHSKDAFYTTMQFSQQHGYSR